MRILVPIDGSACTKRMLDYLIEHPETIGKADDFTLMFVCAPIPLRVAMGMDDDVIAAHYAEEARLATELAMRRFESVGWTHRLLTKIGVPSVEICKEASSGSYDLIVMGNHGRGPVASLLLDSTSQCVLAGCKVPVLSIR
jgi:nucleotide-binding universal stress UspA family protein